MEEFHLIFQFHTQVGYFMRISKTLSPLDIVFISSVEFWCFKMDLMQDFFTVLWKYLDSLKVRLTPERAFFVYLSRISQNFHKIFFKCRIKQKCKKILNIAFWSRDLKMWRSVKQWRVQNGMYLRTQEGYKLHILAQDSITLYITLELQKPG